MNHHLGGADLDTLAAADAVLLVDHVIAGLGTLRIGAVLTGLHALAALDAHIGLRAGAFSYDLNAAVILIKLLIESNGAGPDALQAGHTLRILFD